MIVYSLKLVSSPLNLSGSNALSQSCRSRCRDSIQDVGFVPGSAFYELYDLEKILNVLYLKFLICKIEMITIVLVP